MTVATFGDLLGPARGHLARAGGFPDYVLRGESAFAAAAVSRRLALTLSRYLADIAPYGMAEAVLNPGLRPRMRAAVDGREALRMAAAAFGRATAGAAGPGSGSPDPMVVSLAAAADSLAAGRDLLRTHFAASPDGEQVQRSDWSAVICSGTVTRAMAAEVASWSRQSGMGGVPRRRLVLREKHCLSRRNPACSSLPCPCCAAPWSRRCCRR